MVGTSVTTNNFTLVFQKQKKELQCKYTLADTLIAKKWFAKIKHLKNIPIDPIESDLTDISDLEKIYSDFCIKFDLKKLEFDDIMNQKNLNTLHEIYEKSHDKLSRKKDNHLLYKFHHAIHHAESKDTTKTKIDVGWGVKEGPLTERFPCYDYYADSIQKNNIYLFWAELGKKPLQYYNDEEPNTQERINELCRPHNTLRAKFFIALTDHEVKQFDNKFTEWFKPFKEGWLEAHNLREYTEKDQYSAPLLATADHNVDLTGAQLVKIVV